MYRMTNVAKLTAIVLALFAPEVMFGQGAEERVKAVRGAYFTCPEEVRILAEPELLENYSVDGWTWGRAYDGKLKFWQAKFRKQRCHVAVYPNQPKDGGCAKCWYEAGFLIERPIQANLYCSVRGRDFRCRQTADPPRKIMDPRIR